MNRRIKRIDRDLFQGYRTFECPVEVLSLRGKIPALLALNLFLRACNRSEHSNFEGRVRFPALDASLARKMNVNLSSIGSAYRCLERRKLVTRTRNRSIAGEYGTTEVSVCNPRTGQTLLNSPDRADLLTANTVSSFEVPVEYLEHLNHIPQSSARAVLIAAIYLANEAQAETFDVARCHWRKTSSVCEKSFNHAVKMLGKVQRVQHGKKKIKVPKLLRYNGGTLILLDPQTGKPSQREPLHRKMSIDFELMSASDWERVISEVRKEEFFTKANGWTSTTKHNFCPFCHYPACFNLNFAEQAFHCFKCHEGGKLGFLLKHLTGLNTMPEVADYIVQILRSPIETEVAV